jgi:hypothetical protein
MRSGAHLTVVVESCKFHFVFSCSHSTKRWDHPSRMFPANLRFSDMTFTLFPVGFSLQDNPSRLHTILHFPEHLPTAPMIPFMISLIDGYICVIYWINGRVCSSLSPTVPYRSSQITGPLWWMAWLSSTFLVDVLVSCDPQDKASCIRPSSFSQNTWNRSSFCRSTRIQSSEPKLRGFNAYSFCMTSNCSVM